MVLKKIAQWSALGRRFLLALFLACVVVGVIAVWPSPPPPPFMVLHQPFQMPVSFRDRLDRWIPQTPRWAWAWRVEGSVFDPRKSVNLFAEVISLPDSSDATLSSLSLGSPDFSDTNGLQVWLLGLDQLKTLRERFKQMRRTDVLFRPRMNTADGIESQLFNGQSILLNGATNAVGLTFGCCARVHPDSTDLMVCVTLSELVTNAAVASGDSASLTPISIQTNLAAALRLQIPKGRGIFLLDQSSRDSSRKHIGVIIDLPPAKR